MSQRENAFNSLMTPARVIAAITTNTTTNCIEIDTQGYNSLTFAIFSGTLTDGTYTPLIQETDVSGSGYTDVADADLTVTEASVAFVATDDNLIKKIGYTGNRRYVRLSLVSTGVTSGGTIGAVAIAGHPGFAPVA